MKLHTFKLGGIHPAENKLTASAPITTLELPREVILPFAQHIGAPASCILHKGDSVKRGDIIAKASGFVSANVHTPISGTVTKIETGANAVGYRTDTITITASDAEHETDMATFNNPNIPIRTAEQLKALTAEEVIAIIDEAGIVGLGGATFPTKVKLSPPPGMTADILIINAVECEPYLTNDHALMLAAPHEILSGVRLLMTAAKVNKAVIAIEANKPDAIKLLSSVAQETNHDITIVPLQVKYPQGGEKQLIQAITGKEVPSGALPIATGAIVQNVATAYAVWRAAALGVPLIDRIVTVTGPSISKPGNYKVALGTKLKTLIEYTGGIPADTGKIILGGPMMGKAIANIEATTTKGVSGLLILPIDQATRVDVEPCIRCGTCVTACPMGLEPFLISTLSRLSHWEEAEAEKIINCIECGSCSYVCPASRPLLDYIRLGKSTVGAAIRARSQQAKK
jgi:electron transport complex protein RnfC